MTKQTGYLVTWDEMSTMGATPVEQTTAPTGDKIVTKSESTNYYQWDEKYLLDYVDNQCPPYETFIPVANLVIITYTSSAVGGPDCYIDNNGTHYNGSEEWLMGWDRELASGEVQDENGTLAIFGLEGIEFSAKSYVDGIYSTWGDYTGCTTTVEVYEDDILIASNSVSFTNVNRPDASNWRVDTEQVTFTPIYGKSYIIKTYNHNLIGPLDCDFTATFTPYVITETASKPPDATNLGSLLLDIRGKYNVDKYRLINITPDTSELNQYVTVSETASERRVPSSATTIEQTEMTGPFGISGNFYRFGINIALMEEKYPSINLFKFRLVAKRITVDPTVPMEFGFTYGKKINSLVTWPPPVTGPDIRNGVDFRPPTHVNDITISHGSLVTVTGTDTNTYYSVIRLEYNKSTNVFSLISEGV
jgi:hypothetical protein